MPFFAAQKHTIQIDIGEFIMPVRRRRRHEHTLRFKPDLWGRETESGTVLFDGVVELEEAGEGMLAGFPEGALIPTAGDEYDVTINGTTVSSTAQASDDGGIIKYIDGDTVIRYGYRRGEVTFMCSSNYGTVGSNTLRIALTEFH